ncbi:MAG: 2-dehydro-3-deoxy-D-gluconate 5-dehydrogenase KduD [Saprospiraceae bacterium]|nr:2-dehydro-3-deoxy-D-gluconate 5-dehydrogenase KduD [Saprospiraceae bacterium]
MGILEHFSLEGKVALVTGAAQGLGQAMAVGLAEAGADLLILDKAVADETKALIKHQGRKCFELTVDLEGMNADRADEILRRGIDALGRIDILVNNAGIIRRRPALELDDQDWHEVLDINLNSVFYLSKAVGKHFVSIDQRGKIINLASMLSFQGGLMISSYTAAKSAIAGLTRALANEWAAHQINVNAIAPGYLKTEVTADIYKDPQHNRAILNRIPAGRWGEPNDLKGIVVFLASSASDYLHGSIIAVDGGWLSR